jgi:hypothetical protein
LNRLAIRCTLATDRKLPPQPVFIAGDVCDTGVAVVVKGTRPGWVPVTTVEQASLALVIGAFLISPVRGAARRRAKRAQWLMLRRADLPATEIHIDDTPNSLVMLGSQLSLPGIPVIFLGWARSEAQWSPARSL